MPAIDLSILNQRQTPAFYADTLANRPAAGFVGRIFVSTNTLDLYRDNGTTWDLLSPSSTGTITGSGSAGQVTYFSAASSITGSNDLFFDAVNGHLGIGTVTPGTALDVHHDQPTVAILNQTVATNDVRLGFQNNGVALWRIGAFYNAGANDFGLFDVVGSAQRITVKKTTGQTFIGPEITSAGLLVVNSSASDNHIVAIGANAPSIRINNGSGAKTIGIGISTSLNNFIQGSVDRDMTIFNSSTTPSPILFGIYDAGTTNTQEAARISAARNLLIGTITDAGQKLQVNGTAYISGNTGIGTPTPLSLLDVYSTSDARIKTRGTTNLSLYESLNTSGSLYVGIDNSTGSGFGVGNYSRVIWSSGTGYPLVFATQDTERMRIT